MNRQEIVLRTFSLFSFLSKILPFISGVEEHYLIEYLALIQYNS